MPLDREKLSDMKLKADLGICQNRLAHCIDALRNIVELDPGLWKTQKAIAQTCLTEIEGMGG